MLRFGTDGVRGDADTYLTSPSVVALGRAAARVIGAGEFLIGRDTRESGPRIDADLTRGFAAEGAHVTSLGVASTPAIAFLAQQSRRARRDRVGEPQPVERQRREDRRERRPEAGRRARARDRGRAPAPPRPGNFAAGSARGRRRRFRADSRGRSRCVCRAPPRRARRTHTRRCAHRGRLRQRRRIGAGAAHVRGGRSARRRDQCGARRPQHQRRLRIDPSGAVADARCGPTAPTSGSRSTVTQIAWSPSTRTASSSTATRSW